MPRNRSVPAPYEKQVDSPLPEPRTDSAVNYVQIPENILWNSDNRGFTKRPGSLTVAQVTSGGTAPVRVSGLVATKTPSSVLAVNNSNFSVGSVACDPTTVLVRKSSVYAGFGITDWANDFSPISRLSKILAIDLPDNYFFTRAVYDNTASKYGFSILFEGQTLYDYTDTIASAVPATARYTDFGQQNLPITYLNVDSLIQDRAVVGSTRSAMVCFPREVAPPPTDLSYGTPGNVARTDFASLGEGTFMGGGGGLLQYFDGFRLARAGVGNAVINSAGPGAAGVLTGTYQYFVTQVIRLPSGEVIEGDASPIVSASPAAQTVQVNMSFATGGGGEPGYNATSYSTTIGGVSTGTFTAFPTDSGGTISSASAAILKLEPGQPLVFEVNGICRSGYQIGSISGNTITLSGAGTVVPFTSATVNISTGSSWRLYRTKAGGSIFYQLAEFAGPRSGKTYVDNKADSSLVTQYTSTATTRQGSPAGVQAMTLHQGRIFCLVTNTSTSIPTEYSVASSATSTRVMYSSSLSRHYFPTANSFDLPDDAGNPRGLVSINDTLYIFTDKKIFYTQGTFDDASTFTLNLLTSKLGCRDARSVVSYGHQILFVTDRGLVSLQGTTIDEEIGKPINKLIGKDTITASYVWNAQNLLMLAVANRKFVNTYSTGTTATRFNDALYSTNDVTTQSVDTRGAYTLVYDLDSGRWAKWSINCFNGGCELDRDFLFTGGEDPSAIRASIRRLSLNNNWTDDGVAFTSRYYSQWYDAGIPSVDKSFNRAQIFSTDTLEAGGQNFRLQFSTERDWQPGLTVDSSTIDDFKYQHGYSEQPYSFQAYGDPQLAQKVIPLSNQKAKSLRLVIENSEPNRNIAINATDIEINPKYVNMKDE